MGLPFFTRTRPTPATDEQPIASPGSRPPARSSQPDLYSVLGVPPHATQPEIREAYRRRAQPLIDRWWLPGRAERRLATLNSAYEILSHPSRRAEYDAQQGLGIRHIDTSLRPDDDDSDDPYGVRGSIRGGRMSRGRGTGFLDAIVIVFVVALALGTASVIISTFSPNLGGIIDLTESLGVTPKRRATPTVDARAKPQASPETALVGQATVQPSPTSVPPTGVERYAGTQVELSDPNPARRSDLTVTLRIVRDGQPVEGALTYLLAHYRTTEERWPAGTSTIRSDSGGLANITFNIGDASAGFPVPIDVVTLIDGQQFTWRSQFIPR
jgi:hypothetical protein